MTAYLWRIDSVTWVFLYHLPFDGPLQYRGYEGVIMHYGFWRQPTASSLVHPRLSKLLVEIKQVVGLDLIYVYMSNGCLLYTSRCV